MQQGDPFYSRITNRLLFIKAKESIKKLTFKINFLDTSYAKGTNSFSNKENMCNWGFQGFFYRCSLFAGLKPNDKVGTVVLASIHVVLHVMKQINSETDAVKILGFLFSYNKKLKNNVNHRKFIELDGAGNETIFYWTRNFEF